MKFIVASHYCRTPALWKELQQISAMTDDRNVIATIMASPPKALVGILPNLSMFAPTWDMVSGHKSGILSDAAYTTQFRKVMLANLPQIREFVASHTNVVLLCACPEGKFCHRHLVAKVLVWLGAEQIPVTESYLQLPAATPTQQQGIQIREGDLFTAPVNCLINPVNQVGVMGKGLALTFKQRYPRHYAWYADQCMKHLLCRPRIDTSSDKTIIAFPTKRHWRDASRLDDIDQHLGDMAHMLKHQWIAEHGITGIALPALGCGLGGLAWKDVRPLIEQHLGDLPIPVQVYLQPRAKS